MKISTTLLLVSWIPMLQMLSLRFGVSLLYKVNMILFFAVSILVSIVAAGMLIKELSNNTTLEKMFLPFLKPLVWSLVFLGVPCITTYYFCISDSILSTTPILLYTFLALVIIAGLAVLIKMIPGGKKENESPEKTSEAQAGVPWNKGIQRFKMIMVISLAQLIMCYAIPVIYLRYYYGQFQKVEDFLFLLVILSAFIAFQASLITEIRRTGKYLKPVRDYSLLFFVLFTLFAIPVSIGAALLFDIEPEFFFEPNSPLLLIISIISVVFSLTALAITWKEARKEEKSFLPAFKFVVVSVNLFWQLSLCFHIFYDLSSYLLYYYFEYYNRVYIFDDLKNFGLPLVILSVVFIILHLLFFGNIIFKRGFEGKQRMQLPVLGVFLAAGVYALITLQIWAVRLLPMETNIIICVIMLSFIAIMGPVLVVALLLVGAGGIAALFGRKAGTGPEMTEKGTQLLQVRIKVVIIMLIAIVMYSFLFKTVWPVKDPAIGVLTGLMKKKEPFRRNLVYWGAFRYAAHYELFLYGKKAEEPLMEFLDGNDSQLRLIAANHLAHLKCPGSVDAAYATIVQLMDDEIQPIKRNALKILRLKEEPGAAKVLVRLLDFKKPQVRLKALVLIERYYLGVHKIVEPLIRALDDNYTAVRNEAVHALAFLHDTRVIEPLFKIIEIDENESTIKAAIHALSDYKDATIIDVFIRKLGEKEFTGKFGKDTVAALKFITNKDFGTDQNKWQTWWKKNRDEFISKHIQ